MQEPAYAARWCFQISASDPCDVPELCVFPAYILRLLSLSWRRLARAHVLFKLFDMMLRFSRSDQGLGNGESNKEGNVKMAVE